MHSKNSPRPSVMIPTKSPTVWWVIWLSGPLFLILAIIGWLFHLKLSIIAVIACIILTVTTLFIFKISRAKIALQVTHATARKIHSTGVNAPQSVLDSELEAAQETLATAGIASRYQGHERMLTGIAPNIEAVLSRVVREGVANVITHSHASHCVLAFTRDELSIRLEIADDGQAWCSVNEDAGHSLHSLAEQTRAIGGQFEAASRPTGGFRLAVTLPLALEQHEKSAEHA